MSGVDWARESEEAEFSRREWGSADVVESDDVMQIPGVQRGAPLGFEPVPGGLLFCFLPAVWPDAARAWVRDTRARFSSMVCDEGPVQRMPWSTWTYLRTEAEANETLHECGLPPRPPGRVWLLRPPPAFASLSLTLQHLAKSAEQDGILLYPHKAFAVHVARGVEQLFGPPG